MNKIAILALLVGGVALIIYGISASESISSSFSKFFTGSLTDKSIWMLIAGSVLILVGLGGFFRGSKTNI